MPADGTSGTMAKGPGEAGEVTLVTVAGGGHGNAPRGPSAFPGASLPPESGSDGPRILNCLPLRLQVVRRPGPRESTWPPTTTQSQRPTVQTKDV